MPPSGTRWRSAPATLRPTLARTGPDAQGTPPYARWRDDHPDVALLALADAVPHAELLVNATSGAASVDALAAAGVGERDGLVVLDVANPLVFSGDGISLSVANTTASRRRCNGRFPTARVVKSLNTVNNAVMVDPARVPGEHVMFVAGDDAAAKEVVTGLLGELGWAGRVLDLGGLRAARGMEMYVVLWWHAARALGTFDVNVAFERA